MEFLICFNDFSYSFFINQKQIDICPLIKNIFIKDNVKKAIFNLNIWFSSKCFDIKTNIDFHILFDLIIHYFKIIFFEQKFDDIFDCLHNTEFNYLRIISFRFIKNLKNNKLSKIADNFFNECIEKFRTTHNKFLIQCFHNYMGYYPFFKKKIYPEIFQIIKDFKIVNDLFYSNNTFAPKILYFNSFSFEFYGEINQDIFIDEFVKFFQLR